MKITAISTLVVNAQMRNWIFVRVETDQAGLYGWGEATLEWKTRAVVGAVEDLSPLVVGRDPRDIEQLVRIMRKHGFWRIGVIGSSAVAGIEVALWDILGKSLGVPVWRLLGGRTRDRVRVYTHLGLGQLDAVYHTLAAAPLIERAHKVLERGYRAMKLVFIPYTHYTAARRDIDQVGRMMADLRAAVGDEVELMVDFHGRCASVGAALHYIEALAPGRPLFVEEPLPPQDVAGLAILSQRARVPLAAGERLVDRHEFAPLLAGRMIDIAQPDLCHVGGFTEARKIAALAEANGVGIAPHNPLGPLAGVAALHFDIATPNFVIQEEMSGAVPWYEDVLHGPIRRVDGDWQVPEAPGLGIEIDEAQAARHPFRQEIMTATEARLADGTVVDW
ncbi:galactonate dehydratase [Lichenicoccus sp.]|uniref:galactonate dehydratase n=1 Tax=Lichenicoccus sp. TaxID=2781899 RepID=UPI003D100F7E